MACEFRWQAVFLTGCIGPRALLPLALSLKAAPTSGMRFRYVLALVFPPEPARQRSVAHRFPHAVKLGAYFPSVVAKAVVVAAKVIMFFKTNDHIDAAS